ncbi:MAG: Uma2 family endonuclease, partial [Cyanobacteria bacterium P01_A01_bin.84]
GKIIQKPMPQGKHSTIQTEESAAINVALKPQRIARAFTELRCTFGGRSIIPDISVFSWKRIPRDENGEISNIFTYPPDWSIEILSPDQSQTKVVKNILHCLKYQTQMGWLIDPEEQTVFVYFGETIQVFDETQMILPTPDFAQNFQQTVGELFAMLLE